MAETNWSVVCGEALFLIVGVLNKLIVKKWSVILNFLIWIRLTRRYIHHRLNQFLMHFGRCTILIANPLVLIKINKLVRVLLKAVLVFNIYSTSWRKKRIYSLPLWHKIFQFLRIFSELNGWKLCWLLNILVDGSLLGV